MTGRHDPNGPDRPRDDLDISYEHSRIEPAGPSEATSPWRPEEHPPPSIESGRAGGEPGEADDAALAALDARARAAAAGLHRHVRAHDALGPVLVPSTTPQRQRRGRVLIVAAVVSLIAGFVATQDPGGRDDGRLDLDESELPDMEAGLLTPLGPRDGKDSIQLPLTAEPSTGLRDGDVVTVTAEGFEPGESVGIVQCAREAGGEDPEQRAGAEACNLGGFTGATADADGVATGTHQLQRVLTTPLTGTVDCAAEAERCIVAMGAISDYDRSGGTPLTFDPDVEPVTLPTVSVEPAADLAHGQTVRVVAEGLTPGGWIPAEVCSSDPATCWSVGQTVEVLEQGEHVESYLGVGIAVDDAGRIDTEIQVWRFLPGHESGTYVDCAVSRCSLRLMGEVAPPTVPLGFRGDEPPPEAPAVGVDPATGLRTGDEAIVAGRGFVPGAEVWVDLCVGPVDQPADWYHYCASSDRTAQVDEEGAFALVWKVPDPKSMGTYETCEADGGCEMVEAEDVRCDGVTSRCQIVVYSSSPGMAPGASGSGTPAPPPTFAAAPIPITFGP